jgi:hypothetical protein
MSVRKDKIHDRGIGSPGREDAIAMAAHGEAVRERCQIEV